MDQIQNILQNQILKAAEEKIDAEYYFKIVSFTCQSVKAIFVFLLTKN